MKKYIRIMLGAGSIYAQQCYKEGFIGADYGINQDLTNDLTDNWRDFNKKFIPIWLEGHPMKNKISAGLACGMLWTICKGLNIGDVIISPDGSGSYYVGEINGYYHYKPNENLQHRRGVTWYKNILNKSDISPELLRSMGSIGTTSEVTRYAGEIENLIEGKPVPTIISTDETVEDPSVFALEKHLEEFLVKNWNHTLLGENYNIYHEGEFFGQQYQTDTGSIDILAISKDKKTLLVVELKKGRASDNVVGQIQRYMGYVKEELAEANQLVKGIIIALEDDIRIKRALSVTNNIEFYKYQVSFKLYK